MIAAEPEGAVPLPVLRADLLVQPFDSGMSVHGAAPRYLVICGARQHVIGADAHALLELLRQPPPSWQQLVDRHDAATGRTTDVAALQRLVTQTLPGDWFVGGTPAAAAADPFLWRIDVFDGETLAPLTRRLARLFDRRMVVPVVLAFAAVQALVLPVAATRIHTEFTAAETLCLCAGLVLGIVWHELGHLSAVARAGVRHGGMGVGLYWFVPAMYSEVSQAWRAPPRARVLIDVGGIYFQAMVVIGIGAYAFATDSTFAYKLGWMTTFTMLHTLNPFFKFDGYWLLSDASGLTNLHAQVRRTVVGAVRRLFRLPAEPRSPQHRLQLAVLYAYTALCGVYLAWIVYFLRGALVATANDYPARLDLAWTQATRAVAVGDASAALQGIASLIASSAWPACLAVSCGAVAWIVLTRVATFVGALVARPRVAGGSA